MLTLRHAPADVETCVFNTCAGWVGVSISESGVNSLILPHKAPEDAARLLGTPLDREKQVPAILTDLVSRLRRYFNGETVSFADKLDLAEASPFTLAVWEAARLIPYGETRTYSWIAAKIGRPGAVRAVGNALGRNPVPLLIPCHRVLHRDGGLGGFAYGLETKEFLLKLEGRH